MAWNVPSLADLRKQVRDYVAARLPGADANIPNSPLRVISDNQAGLASGVLDFIRWLSKQMLPDTAEAEWLVRHANIWLGGPKAGTFAEGAATFTGTIGTVVPIATQLSYGGILYETLGAITIGVGATSCQIHALQAGTDGNRTTGDVLSLVVAISGVDSAAVVVSLDGGVDQETTEEMRGRVLERIRKPPMGGDADDYVAWAKEVPGVTRAWCSPREMGVGTVTVRFMMDDLRAGSGGFPNSGDIASVKAYLDMKRPVAVKDFFVEAPIPEPISFTISGLFSDDASTRANIALSVAAMLADKAAPAFAINGVAQDAQTIYAAWVSEAIMQAAGVEFFDLTMADHVMPSKGALATLGTVTYG
jgi:uncharacterized phage protein gp47/JayE